MTNGQGATTLAKVIERETVAWEPSCSCPRQSIGITAEAWYARGIVNAIAVPLVAVAARRSPQWSLDVFVSRQVVFYTTSFVGVGAYLLLMSLGGYYVREIGGQWGRVGQFDVVVGVGRPA